MPRPEGCCKGQSRADRKTCCRQGSHPGNRSHKLEGHIPGWHKLGGRIPGWHKLGGRIPGWHRVQARTQEVEPQRSVLRDFRRAGFPLPGTAEQPRRRTFRERVHHPSTRNWRPVRRGPHALEYRCGAYAGPPASARDADAIIATQIMKIRKRLAIKPSFFGL